MMLTFTAALPRPRLVLLTVDTELNGTVNSDPSPPRRRTVRIDRYSTVPDTPASVTESPTCIAFSINRKMPVIKSCTSFCEPKPSATPKMLALATSGPDRRSTRLNSSHMSISYAVFCLKKKKKNNKVKYYLKKKTKKKKQI